MVRQWMVCGLACLSLGGWLPGAQGAVPGVPVPTYPVDGLTTTALRQDFEYEGAPNTTWHNVYFQRNGGLFKSIWTKAYEDPWNNWNGWFSSDDVVGYGNVFPAGNYRWRVRGWNASGYGPWSTNRTFSVPFIVPGAPTPLQPIGTNTAFVWFAMRSTNTMVTWCNVEVKKNGVFYKNLWGQVWGRGDRYIWLSDSEELPADPRWPAGNYTWRGREWSPVSGMGPWSTSVAFTVWSEAAPKAMTNLEIDVSGFYSSVRPYFSGEYLSPDAGLEDTASATWTYMWLNRNGKTYERGISRRESRDAFEGGMQGEDLPAGTYDWWIQTMNSKGTSAFVKGPTWTSVPVVPQKAVLTNLNVMIGKADMMFALQKAVYWYQMWITRNGSTYVTKWMDFQCEDGNIYDDSDWNQHVESWVDGDMNVNLTLRSLDPGSYKVWIKTYTSAGLKWSDPVSFTIAGQDTWDPADNAKASATLLIPDVNPQDHGPHILSTSDTQDWFRIEMEAGTTYHFADAGSDWTACAYRLYKAPGTGDWVNAEWIAPADWNWNWSGFECQETGTYYMQIRDYDAGRPWSDPVKEYTLRYWLATP